MSINELENKVRELRQLQTLIEEAQAEAETLKDEIKSHMGDRETMWAGGYRITYKPITTCRIDTQALKNTLPDIAQRFTRETITRRFCII